MLYMILACYYSMKNSPMIATFWLSMGLGVKAGVLLLIPGFLGSIQYNHGTITLIKAIVFIIVYQIVIALPFVLGNSTVYDYIQRSKLTGAGRDGIAGAAMFWDYLAAHQDLSILWTFIPNEIYFVKELFSDRVKMAMLFCNIWNFFIRQNCSIKYC